MSAKLKALILKTIPATGHNLALAMGEMENHLTQMENKDVHGFLKWAFFDWDERGFESGNIDQRWEQWLNHKPDVASRKRVSTMLGKMMTREDNKALTLGALYDTLFKLRSDPKMTPADWLRPVVMSSDEEGNDMLHLWGIEVSKSGSVTLWPAHS